MVTVSPSEATVAPPHSAVACSGRAALVERTLSRNAGLAEAVGAKLRHAKRATTKASRITRRSMPDPRENTLRVAAYVSFGSAAATTGAMESDRNPLAMLALAL